MPRIFLSYARDDVAAAEQLADCITQAGHDVWWDHQLHGGSRFAKEIDRALKEAEAVIVLWSEASLDSAWVQDEASEGRDSGRLVPVAIGSAKPPLGFRQFQTIDLGSWTGQIRPEALDQVLHAINRTCSSGAGPQRVSATNAAEPSAKPSICVLPFANMSGDPEQEYFSDGISEDITTDLSKISALEVVARNTAFTFKGQSIDVAEVAKALRVSHVLEGSVRKAGSRVRINAQLIDGSNGKHLWADRFDRDLTDIFEIQDELSKAIVEALKVKLLPEEKSAIEQRGTNSVEAYNLYLLAHNYWLTGHWGDVQRVELVARICKRAIDIDPGYARAWGLLAIVQTILYFTFDKGDEDSLATAERALELDPSLAEARVVKARHLFEQQRFDEANDALERAIALDPESWEVNREAARISYAQRRFSEASRYYEKAVSLDETDYHSWGMLTSVYEALGDHEAVLNAARCVVSAAERVTGQNPTNGLALCFGAMGLAILGDKERFREWVDRALLVEPDNLVLQFNLACAYVTRLHDHEGALDLLEDSLKKVNRSTIRGAFTDPDLDPLRELPRFKKMLAEAMERLGMESASK